MGPKENIIHHTLKLLNEKGYDRTSVRDIAGASGVNVAMINYYFGNKEALFEAAIQEKLSFVRKTFTDLAANRGLTAMGKMEVVIDLIVERKFSNRMLHHLMHSELALQDRPQLKEKISEFLMLNISPVKKIIREGIDSGEFQEVDVELTVATAIGTIHYLLINDILCQKILEKNSRYTPFNNKALKARVSNHLKRLLSAFLIK